LKPAALVAVLSELEIDMKFVAFERKTEGTGASRRLRNSGKTPGIVYGGEGQPQLVELDHNALWHALKKEAFHSSILEMELGGQTGKVLLRDVQYHPFRQQVLHIDFQRVDANTRLHMKVPVHYKGAEESDAVKLEHCLVNPIVTELEVSCLPADLPEFIEVDLSGLKKGSTLHLKDIKLPKGIKPVTHGKPNPVLVSVVTTAAEESAEAADAAAAPAADAKAAPAKGGKDAKAAAKPAAKAPAAKK
jgi:large subunit ribosomal protein L25